MRFTSLLLSKVGDLTKQYSNLPETYIKRAMEKVYWRTPRGFPQYLPRTVAKKKYRFTTNRPWTGQFEQQNMSRQRKKVFLQPVLEWSFFRGDRVEILVGPDKGKQGIVSQVIQERNWVIVEGMNCHLRTIGKSKDFPGVVIRSEAPLLVTDQVALVDPSDLQPAAVEWRYTEDGDKVRVSVRTGRIIPIPKLAAETHDYKTKNTYKESEKDTGRDEVAEITFEPKLKTFEMDIMDSMGIKEDRVPAKTYWY
ncbi:probable 39S ribosomal protein L24, mitochondrial [Schistocerca gregaria]|uniref:probable 39S ribosomal protein L24, mitochondrial n=1 Tax=Schistocerca gregaria TaxID=7010 RepID=UPI00211EDE08|nr:probable 39S ribosomal protein L24, mitochondrial [Schistocerca gregaria]